MPHNTVFENGLRPHRFERRFHLLGRRTRTRQVVVGVRQQHLAPVPQRRETGRDRAEGGESIKLCFCLRCVAKLQERQRLLQMPVARRAQTTAGRRRPVKHRQRVAGAFVLQKVRRQVKPCSGVIWISGDGRLKQLYGGFGFAADPHKGGEI